MSSSTAHVDDVYKRFNTNVKMFLKELMRSFPDVKELHFVYAAYKLVKTFGRKIVQRYFDESFGEPFGDRVKARDEAFFMSPNFKLPKEYSFYNEYIISFQRLWQTLDDKNKDAVWQHLNALLFLNNECINYKKSKKTIS